MNKSDVLKVIGESKLAAVVRVDAPEAIDPTVDALLAGGVHIIELTMTIPGVLKYMPSVAKRIGGEMVLGIGSVLSGEIAQQAIDAGATFVVSPILKKEIIDTAKKNDVAVAAGAYSPTEIQTAWEYGSDVVKVFPADRLGPGYIKGVRAPMPHLKLLPTGGVQVDNVGEWLAAGAFALGVGGALVDIRAVHEGKFDVITKNAAAFRKAVDEYNVKQRTAAV
jgi:2-dehydro-3-deoxyphosphogluconate aldolase / (4S)-4-hydroxy-2-oxoglutarate aldolase